jgi:hypothetical protein
MKKLDVIHNQKASSTLYEKIACSGRCYVLGILIISLIAFAPVVDAGCSCSAGNWDPSAFLNSELGTSQPVQSGGAQNSAAGNLGSSKQKPLERAESFPNQKMFKPMKAFPAQM